MPSTTVAKDSAGMASAFTSSSCCLAKKINCAFRLHGARGGLQSHTSSLPAETYTILSRSGRKTTPPGQEGPIQNQNLRYRTLPFDAVVRDMSLVVLSVRLFS